MPKIKTNLEIIIGHQNGYYYIEQRRRKLTGSLFGDATRFTLAHISSEAERILQQILKEAHFITLDDLKTYCHEQEDIDYDSFMEELESYIAEFTLPKNYKGILAVENLKYNNNLLEGAYTYKLICNFASSSIPSGFISQFNLLTINAATILSKTCNYHMGQLHGTETIMYANNVTHIKRYKHDILNGRFTINSNNYSLIGSYKDGLPTGIWTSNSYEYREVFNFNENNPLHIVNVTRTYHATNDTLKFKATSNLVPIENGEAELRSAMNNSIKKGYMINNIFVEKENNHEQIPKQTSYTQ